MISLASTAGLAAELHVDALRGDDAAEGSATKPWRSISKAAAALKPGDVCVIAPGIYRETVTPVSDGVTFRAAPGGKVIVSGCDEVSGWTKHHDAVYRAAVPAEVREVFVGEAMMNPARFPNEDGDRLSVDEWAASDFANVKRDKTGSAEVSFDGENWPDGHWDGAYYCGLHGKNFFQANFGRVTATHGGVVHLDSLSGAVLNNPPEFGGPGRGYLIRHLNALDSPREWHWEKGALYFQPEGESAPKQVEARTRLWGFNLSGRRGVMLEGIRFFAASVLMDGSRECELSRCDFLHHSPWGSFREPFTQRGERGWYAYGTKEDGTAGVFIRGEENRVAHCTFRDFWGQGVHLREGRGNVVEHCSFENFNWLMLQDGAAVFLNGEGHEVRDCRIRNTAAMGISGKQVGERLVHGVKVLRNDIADTGRVLLDSGQSAIYFNNHNAPSEQRSLDGEIAWNRIGTVHGIADNGKGIGIYLDDGTDHANLHHNIVEAGPKVRWPIFLHAAGHVFENVTVRNNLIWGVPDDPRAAAIVAMPRPKVGALREVIIRGNLSSRAIFKVLPGSSDGVTLEANEENISRERFDQRIKELGVVQP